MSNYLLTAGLLLCLNILAIAQDDYANYSYGDITAEDRSLLVAPGDSTAEAYVLYDLLRMDMIMTPEGRPGLQEYRHRQLKLLRESSFGRADIEIIYYRESEKVKNVKATIHLPDGKSIKIPRKDMIREHYDEDREIVKFTFPNVTEGAIIEYSYTNTSESILIPSRYQFQEDIPVRWAEYQANIPVYYDYVSLSNAANMAVNTIERKQMLFAGSQVNHAVIRRAFADLAAYTDQPYVNNFRDYVPHVRLQLASIRYPNQPINKIFSDWQQTTEELMDFISFGRAFTNKSNYNRVWKAVEPRLQGLSTEKEKAAAIYNFVTGSISWNGYFSRYAERTPNKVFEAAEGTSGEMSILLLALLKAAGIEAHPLLVPLRNNGSPVELYPLLTQFQHSMVLATLDGEPTMLDPNSPSRPMGLPRFYALNHRVFVADPADPRWIDIEVPPAVRTVMANVTLAEDGAGEVSIESRLNSYYAFNGRNAIREKEEDGDLPIMDNVLEAFPEAELVSHQVVDKKEISGPLNMNFELKVPMGQPIEDFLYVQPILCSALEKELVDEDNRLYPVDFGFPWSKRYITNITLPEGYAVEELPKSIRMKSEDGSMRATMAASKVGENAVSINFSVSVSKTVFKPEEYAVLQSMFRQIIELQETTLVLKKAK